MAEACIRCGDCVTACPEGLAPQRLHDWLQAGLPDAAAAAGLGDCTRCGRCSEACPSGIALCETFAAAQAQQAEASREHYGRDAARVRYRTRQARLARDAAERAAQDAERQRAAPSADAVAAAIARAKAKRDAAKGKPAS